MDVHLDLFGGLAGDMFIAALLDACPEFEERVLDAIHGLHTLAPVACSLLAHRDQILTGRRFSVSAAMPASPMPFVAGTAHAHTSWKSVRAGLEHCALNDEVRHHAVGIFELLAEAEGFVHGVPIEDVAFHEVGAWDSIADIVGAAVLIQAIGGGRWTYSAAPLGSGQVHTAHGWLPVPAPATTRLLLGMRTLDDGIGGERVTPTGAAILRYLCPPGALRESAPLPVRTLLSSGTGFGFRTLPGRSNHLRALCFEDSSVAQGGRRELHCVEFEVDDQTAEDLAAGLDRLRLHDGVLDVTQSAVIGKKGRAMAHVRVLAQAAMIDCVVDACFRETTTIGLRVHAVRGIGLRRSFRDVTIDGQRVRVKVVERPGGNTAKAESDDLAGFGQSSQRAEVRARAESAALQEGAAADA